MASWRLSVLLARRPRLQSVRTVPQSVVRILREEEVRSQYRVYNAAKRTHPDEALDGGGLPGAVGTWKFGNSGNCSCDVCC